MPNPNDPVSFNHCYTQVNGVTLHYVDHGPRHAHVLVFLVHGFPDLWLTWRHLIPVLAARGYRVIAPSLRGFGESSVVYAPTSDPEKLALVSLRTHCLDLALLAQSLGVPTTGKARATHRFVWLGHDWGSAIVSRMPHYHGHLVDALGSLCVPYTPPHTQYFSTRQVAKQLPHFNYQVVFDEKEGKIDAALDNRVEEALVGFFQPWQTLELDTVATFADATVKNKTSIVDAKLYESCLLKSQPHVWAYYLSSFKRTGFHAGLAMYRVRKINFEDELPIARAGQQARSIHQPFLFVSVDKDPCFPPTMGTHMAAFVPNMTVRHVEGSGHWIQQEQPDKLADAVTEWLQDVQKVWFAGSIFKVHVRKSRL
ncbi:Alpha/Beta hydrolase protein [Catenaria anguillulae PL171]|uniref:Alpha/Beta hydrolase protein n=1 Tax=Catenaria anguillulae PL171 TaxID=765915 RepID=A0A1Y2HZM1_9FUNG|nr:Alpha/Beta hydrolase protein [Catenaria anguillulae PL171]